VMIAKKGNQQNKYCGGFIHQIKLMYAQNNVSIFGFG
jgi:hypothetical protein